MKDWNTLADRLKKHNVKFIIEPYIRFEGEPGEQATMFLKILQETYWSLRPLKICGSCLRSDIDLEQPVGNFYFEVLKSCYNTSYEVFCKKN